MCVIWPALFVPEMLGQEVCIIIHNIGYYFAFFVHRWAMSEGYGSHLIKHPELVADMVRQAVSRTSLPVSIKIRIHQDLR